MLERVECDSDPPPAIGHPRGPPELESGENWSGERDRACLFVLAALASC